MPEDKKQYIPLHLHSKYSFLDGLIDITELSASLKQRGISACAITDHHSMWGVCEFYQTMRAAEIKPIIGCEFYVSDIHSERKLHLVLLAATNEGYFNLLSLYRESFNNKPVAINLDMLKTMPTKGIICLSACIGGHIPSCLVGSNRNNYASLITEYLNIFEDRFFFELMPNSIKEQRVLNDNLIELSKKWDIPLVMTCDSHYIDRKDAKTQDLVRAIAFKQPINNNKYKYEKDEFWLLTLEEMKEMVLANHSPAVISEFDNIIANTHRIAGMVNLDIDFKKDYMPKYKTDNREPSYNISKLLNFYEVE